MLELGHLHAQLEASKQLDPLLETLVQEPVYEFYPLGLGFRGGERTRRYYEQFFVGFMERIEHYALRGEWASEVAVVQEYDITTAVDGLRETHRVVGILFGDGERLGGERVYASERGVRLMTGELFDELTPLIEDAPPG